MAPRLLAASMNAPLRRNGKLVVAIERSCEHKVRYSDEPDARAAGAIDSAKHQVAMWVYPCKICRGWHLTKSRQNDKARKCELLLETK